MQNIHTIYGNPPPLCRIYERLFSFIDNTLPNFRVLNTKSDGNRVTAEDDITEDLADFLDSEQESLNQDLNFSFRFTNQSSSSDIGVKLGRGYTAKNRKSFCWIEAKILPTPNAGKNRDEREYVFVDKKIKNKNYKRKYRGNGGIQRFKEGKHAPTLTHSIMIGYIQDRNNVDFWLSKINSWITDLANTENTFWSIEDCLEMNLSGKCNRFLSTHKRKDGKTIEIHHYWIKC